MHEHITPEERLLKLIRKKTPHSSGDGKDSAVKSVKRPQNLKGLGSRGVFGAVNKFFMAVCVLLAGYIGYEFLIVKNTVLTEAPESKTTVSDSAAKEMILQPESLLQAKPYTYYTAPIEERDIFETPFSPTKKVAETQVVSNIPELTKNLRLVGIVLDGNSQAIIEDVEAKQTFFLHQGEGIRGSVIDEIQESRVILLYQDQRVELTQ